ncbi:MAG: four helix bundle protein [Bacteroidales bacterium]|nr:four helix bundle protein [Bacteroidales bacterium]
MNIRTNEHSNKKNKRIVKEEGKQERRNFDLEQRLIDFAVLIIKITESLNGSIAAKLISGQFIRSGFSSSLHYGEVKDAESRNDFIHKVKVVLKELRETFIALKIIRQTSLSKNQELVDKGLAECNELISIFVKSIETARNNNKTKTYA